MVSVLNDTNLRQPTPGIYDRFLLPVVLLAAICRIYHLDFNSLWADELWGVEFCSHGWWAMIDNLIHKDSHPPGYQTLLYLWMQWLGSSDFIVRLPSAMAGVTSVWVLYRFAGVFFSPFIAILSTAFLACSYSAILYGQEARAYIFLTWFAVWYFDSFLKVFLLGKHDGMTKLQLLLSGLLLIYFHYVGVVLVMGSALVLLVMPASPNRLKRSLQLYLALLLFYAPWMPALYIHLFHSDPSFSTPVPGWQKLLETARFILGPDDVRFYVGVISLSVFLGLCCQRQRRQPLNDQQRVGLLMLFFCLIPVAIFFMESHLGPSSYTVRHFVYIIPFACIVMAWFVEYLLMSLEIALTSRVVLISLLVTISLSTYLNVTPNFLNGGKLYTEVRKIEYRSVVNIIAQDHDFMSGPRHIFSANLFFDHYLKQQHIRVEAEKQWHWDMPERIKEYSDYLKSQHIDEFYYLEVLVNPVTKEPSPLLAKLQKHYYTVCNSSFVWAQAVKFSTVLPPQPDEKAPLCPRTMSIRRE